LAVRGVRGRGERYTIDDGVEVGADSGEGFAIGWREDAHAIHLEAERIDEDAVLLHREVEVWPRHPAGLADVADELPRFDLFAGVKSLREALQMTVGSMNPAAVVDLDHVSARTAVPCGDHSPRRRRVHGSAGRRAIVHTLMGHHRLEDGMQTLRI